VLFLGAKVLGTAIVARLFLLTHDQLMRIGWFRACYVRLMPWKEALVERVRQSHVWKLGRVIKHEAKRVIAPIARDVMQRARRLLGLVRSDREP
jgi:hypothetical protein